MVGVGFVFVHNDASIDAAVVSAYYEANGYAVSYGIRGPIPTIADLPLEVLSSGHKMLARRREEAIDDAGECPVDAIVGGHSRSGPFVDGMPWGRKFLPLPPPASPPICPAMECHHRHFHWHFHLHFRVHCPSGPSRSFSRSHPLWALRRFECTVGGTNCPPPRTLVARLGRRGGPRPWILTGTT